MIVIVINKIMGCLCSISGGDSGDEYDYACDEEEDDAGGGGGGDDDDGDHLGDDGDERGEDEEDKGGGVAVDGDVIIIIIIIVIGVIIVVSICLQRLLLTGFSLSSGMWSRCSHLLLSLAPAGALNSTLAR